MYEKNVMKKNVQIEKLLGRSRSWLFVQTPAATPNCGKWPTCPPLKCIMIQNPNDVWFCISDENVRCDRILQLHR